MSGRRTLVKMCGCTSPADAALALAAGADAIGVVLAERSERRVTLERLREIAASLPALTPLVAVLTDPPSPLVDEVLKAGAIPQFHGDEPADACEAFAEGPYIKAVHVDPRRDYTDGAFAAQMAAYAHATWLFDTARSGGGSGGTGRTFPWEIAPRLAGNRPFIVSGGLTPENVGACVRQVRPYAVDVRSGIETNGVKDASKMHAFVAAVRAAADT